MDSSRLALLMTVVTNVGLKSSRVNRFTITVLTSKIQSKFFKEFDRKLKRSQTETYAGFKNNLL